VNSDHLQLIKFWGSCAPGKGSAAGRNFLAPPYYKQRAVFASLRPCKVVAVYNTGTCLDNDRTSVQKIAPGFKSQVGYLITVSNRTEHTEADRQYSPRQPVSPRPFLCTTHTLTCLVN